MAFDVQMNWTHLSCDTGPTWPGLEAFSSGVEKRVRYGMQVFRVEKLGCV